MQHSQFPYWFYPLGDAAITIDYGNRIDEQLNREVTAGFMQLQQKALPFIKEIVPAYSSLTVHFDIAVVHKLSGGIQAAEWVKGELEKVLNQSFFPDESLSALVRIPVCYEKEFATDLQRVAIAKKLSVEEVIQIHTSATYRVYMLGFLPGFAYMGTTDERIAVPRKPQPVNISAGSVGIAGRQTGIYPLASPGGWQIIGKTPLHLFNAAAVTPVFLKAGDNVQFYSITKKEFDQLSHGI